LLLLSQHIRQIGVMKAIGARTGQIVAMYLTLILSFGLLAYLVAVPTAGWFAYQNCIFVSSFLNFNLAGFRIPPTTLGLQAAVALVVPLLAALIPVRRGARLTVREAIGSYGLNSAVLGGGAIDRLVERVRRLPRPLLISLRNTFRQKGRLSLTLLTLTLGGAIFMAVFNLWAAFNAVIPETLGYFLSDVNLTFDRPYRMQRVEPLVMSVPEIVHVEGWGEESAQVLYPDKETGTEIFVIAPPAGSELIEPVLTSGRWLVPEDENALVIGNHLLKKRPELRAGDTVVLDIGGRESEWVIVGTYKLVGNVIPPIVYANREALARAKGQVDRVSSLRIVTDPQDEATQERVAQRLEALLQEEGIGVVSAQTGAENIKMQTQTTDIFVYFLLTMAVMIAVVGALGLMGTMSMNVIERTREIGVMRSIGASNGAIQQLVIVEGIFVGLISWTLAIVLAQPLSALLTGAVGVALLQSPMDYAFSLEGLLIWLVTVLVLSALASYLPARRANRLTIREVLAYE
jgi:putative ABC transport system permease protein